MRDRQVARAPAGRFARGEDLRFEAVSHGLRFGREGRDIRERIPARGGLDHGAAAAALANPVEQRAVLAGGETIS